MILRIAALGALGYAGFRFFEKQKSERSGASRVASPMDTWDMIEAQGDGALVEAGATADA